MEKHIDLIMPTVHFNHVPSPMFQRQRTGGLGALESQPGPHRVEEEVTVIPTLAKCDMLITMKCLRALYNIDYTRRIQRRILLGLVSFAILRLSQPLNANPHSGAYAPDLCRW